jgi:transcription antitermination factor NusG
MGQEPCIRPLNIDHPSELSYRSWDLLYRNCISTGGNDIILERSVNHSTHRFSPRSIFQFYNSHTLAPILPGNFKFTNGKERDMQSIPSTRKNGPFEPSMQVRILEGPFADFRGIIQAVDLPQQKAVVAINFFTKKVVAEFRFTQMIQDGG